MEQARNHATAASEKRSIATLKVLRFGIKQEDLKEYEQYVIKEGGGPYN